MRRLEHARILMYSHDTFGLGHLRRCRTIAHSLVENYRGLSVLIVSGSTIAGAFDYRVRVDFVNSIAKSSRPLPLLTLSHPAIADFNSARTSSGTSTSQTRKPALIPSFFGSGVPEYPGMACDERAPQIVLCE